MKRKQSRFQVTHSGETAPLCVNCNAPLVWHVYPPLPFPEVASPEQLKRQEKGGQWVHKRPDLHGPTSRHDEWCAPSTALAPAGTPTPTDSTPSEEDGR